MGHGGRDHVSDEQLRAMYAGLMTSRARTGGAACPEPEALLGLSGQDQVDAFFEDPGCTGAALVPEGPSLGFESLLPATAVDQDVLRVGVAAPPVSRTVTSRWDARSRSCQDIDPGITAPFLDTEAFVSLDGLAFPLAVR